MALPRSSGRRQQPGRLPGQVTRPYGTRSTIPSGPRPRYIPSRYYSTGGGGGEPPDYAADGYGGSSYIPYDATETGFYATMDYHNRQLAADIAATQQRLEELRIQEEGATGRQREKIAADRRDFEEQLNFQREQFSQGIKEFDATFGLDEKRFGLEDYISKSKDARDERRFGLEEELGRGGLELDRRAMDLKELESDRGYDVDLKRLDIDKQGLAIQARKAELDHEVDMGRLSVEQARLSLEREVESGRLKLGQAELAEKTRQFDVSEARAGKEFGQEFGLKQQYFGLDKEKFTESTRQAKAAEKLAKVQLIADRYGRDPMRQALTALNLAGGTTAEEATMKSIGLNRPTSETVTPLRPEAAPTQETPIVAAAAEGGTFDMAAKERGLPQAPATKQRTEAEWAQAAIDKRAQAAEAAKAAPAEAQPIPRGAGVLVGERGPEVIKAGSRPGVVEVQPNVNGPVTGLRTGQGPESLTRPGIAGNERDWNIPNTASDPNTLARQQEMLAGRIADSYGVQRDARITAENTGYADRLQQMLPGINLGGLGSPRGFGVRRGVQTLEATRNGAAMGNPMLERIAAMSGRGWGTPDTGELPSGKQNFLRQMLERLSGQFATGTPIAAQAARGGTFDLGSGRVGGGGRRRGRPAKAPAAAAPSAPPVDGNRSTRPKGRDKFASLMPGASPGFVRPRTPNPNAGLPGEPAGNITADLGNTTTEYIPSGGASSEPTADDFLKEFAGSINATTTAGLEKALGLNSGRLKFNLDTGIEGLPPAVKAAMAYQTAGLPVKTLIESGFGVGGAGGGINEDELQRQIYDVTPRGALSY